MDKTHRSTDKAKDETWNIFGFERENIFHQQEYGWPPRNYTCSFCKRQFRSAQGLGGHMNVHRRERARLRHHSPDSWNIIESSNPNLDLDDHKPDLNSNPTPLPLSPEADHCGASSLASSQDLKTAAAKVSAGSSHHLAKDGDGDVVMANKKNKMSPLSDFGWKSTSAVGEGDGGGFEEIIENGKVVLVDGLDLEMGLMVRGSSTAAAIKDLDLELRLGYP